MELLETSNHKKGKDEAVGEQSNGEKRNSSRTQRRCCKNSLQRKGTGEKPVRLFGTNSLKEGAV